jgi:hypothetical protein
MTSLTDSFAHIGVMKDATETVMFLRTEDGEITLDDIVDIDTDSEDLAEIVAGLWLLAVAWKSAANRVEKIIGAGFVERCEGRSVEVAGQLVFTTKGTPTEKCTDIEAFHDWLEDNPSQIRRILNPNNVKFGSLPPIVREKFFEKKTVVKPDSMTLPASAPLEVLEANRLKQERET